MTHQIPAADRVSGSAAPKSARIGARRRRIRRLSLTLSITAVLAIAGGYLVAAGLAALPALTPVSADPASQEFAVSTDELQASIGSFPEPTAVAWADGDIITNDGETPRPLASITKLVTVLVALDERPLAAGATGETYTWTAADTAMQDRLRAQLAIVYPTEVGTRITERDMLTMILLPSANDYATAYANWVFGENDRFVAATQEWAEDHGLDSLQIVEPSGLDEGNQASAADLVRIARLALENPTVLEFTKMRSATVPGQGTIVNTNPMLSRAKGIVGFKTGTTDVAGKNLLVAQRTTVSGRDVVAISAVLARRSDDARIAASAETLGLLATSPEPVSMVADGEVVGSVTTWQGERIELRAEGTVTSVLLPGESATRTNSVTPVGAGPAGQRVGEIRVDAPIGVAPIPVITAAAIQEPDFWWRITHPATVFGWE